MRAKGIPTPDLLRYPVNLIPVPPNLVTPSLIIVWLDSIIYISGHYLLYLQQ